MTFDFPYTDEEKTLLQTWQQYQTDCLVRLDQFMQAEEFTYWIECGTLLGAVRHKGFIPWDDDLDLAMLEGEFLRLTNFIRDHPDAGQAFGILIRLNPYAPSFRGKFLPRFAGVFRFPRAEPNPVFPPRAPWAGVRGNLPPLHFSRLRPILLNRGDSM